MTQSAACRQIRQSWRHTSSRANRRSAVNTGFHGYFPCDLHRSVRIKDDVKIDPACGSGNFLTETYLCLRKLEDSVLSEVRKAGLAGQMQMTGSAEEERGERISLAQFHGIEINDFAVSVAETALYISRLKANADTMMLLDVDSGDLPLKESAHIVLGNALRMDWNDVISAKECDFIMGNPPFVGHNMQSHTQEEEIRTTFPKSVLISKLDYVTAWFYTAMRYIGGTKTRVAFVATNSICQGEQVHKLWGAMFDLNAHIDFAHKTFKWDSEANDKANVFVVIVGFGDGPIKETATLFDYPDITGQPIIRTVAHINGYLIEGEDVFVGARRQQISGYPKMAIGTRPVDGGHYLFDEDDYRSFVELEPDSKPLFKKYVGAKEFISRTYRWLLLLGDISDEELLRLPLCKARVDAVRDYRLQSLKAATRKRASTPTRLEIENFPISDYLILPSVSSQRRKYMPIGFMSPETVPSSLVLVLPNADLFVFGVLTSLFHNAWMRVVAGRLKADYRYGGDLVYNNFVWPSPTDVQKAKIESCAQAVLDARDNHPGDSLATLYDPDKMPADLLAAHKALDKAVEEAYGVEFDGDEEKIVAHLFKLYQEKVEELEEPKEKAPEKPKPAKTIVKVKIRKDKGAKP